MTRIKICGLTTYEDAHHAAVSGADMLGFIMAPVSKRYIEPTVVRAIIDRLRVELGNDVPTCVGVFVAKDLSPDDLEQQSQSAGVDAAQVVGVADSDWLHALTIPAYGCIRPASIQQAEREARHFERITLPKHLPTLQVDTFHPMLYGGTGETTPVEIAVALKHQTQRLMLSGGLTPENVADYVRQVNPWAVDVASGTESQPGQKDPRKVETFIAAVRDVKEMI